MFLDGFEQSRLYSNLERSDRRLRIGNKVNSPEIYCETMSRPAFTPSCPPESNGLHRKSTATPEFRPGVIDKFRAVIWATVVALYSILKSTRGTVAEYFVGLVKFTVVFIRRDDSVVGPSDMDSMCGLNWPAAPEYGATKS